MLTKYNNINLNLTRANGRTMKKLITWSILLNVITVSAFAKVSPYEAARHGDLDTLRQYRFEGEDLYLPDARGFTPYELSALHANVKDPKDLRKHVEVMLWLKEFNTPKHHYGKATIKLIQAGLELLGYGVSGTDGLLGTKTIAAIKKYQEKNKLAVTGRPGPQWLGVFYHDVLKKLQSNLNKLGYKAGSSDGVMGKNTQMALLKYRKDNKLSDRNYAHVDALIISHVNRSLNKQATSMDTESYTDGDFLGTKEQIRYAQAGLSLSGYSVGGIDGYWGEKSRNAVKKLQKAYKLPVTGKIDNKTYELMKKVFLKNAQRKLNALGYKAGEADGQMGRNTRSAIERFNKKYRIKQSPTLTATLMTKLYGLNKKTASVSTRQNKVKKKQQVVISTRNSTKSKVKKPIKNTAETQPIRYSSTQKKGRHVKGSMSFTREGGRVVGCRLAGRRIPLEWCEPFYPLPRNNYCEASFSPTSGSVTNLWCK